MTEIRHTPDSLADHLDQLIPPHSAAPAAQVDDPLIEAAARLANAPRPGLPADARARIEARLLQPPHKQKPVLRPDFGGALRWGLVASAVLVLLFVPTVQATLASVPGEIFYPLKQTIEQVEMSFAASPEAQVMVNLTHAERRTQEAQVLLGRGQFNPGLVTAAYQNLSNAATIIHGKSDFDPNLKLQTQLQTVALTAVINQLLVAAAETENGAHAPLATQIALTRDSGLLMLPATESSTPTMTTTETPTASPTPTETPTHTVVPTSTVTATIPMTPTLETNLVITGPIEAINGNIITIYGIEITINPDDPLLRVIQVGDKVRINASAAESGANTVLVTTINIEPTDDSLAVSDDGQSVWRDTGGCDNPPPPWATANGWRARCEGQRNNTGSPGNQSSGRGSNGNNNRGQGQGNGNRDDDD